MEDRTQAARVEVAETPTAEEVGAAEMLLAAAAFQLAAWLARH